MPTSDLAGRIEYSEKYQDDSFEYRHVRAGARVSARRRMRDVRTAHAGVSVTRSIPSPSTGARVTARFAKRDLSF